jgi:hypothetical protein
LLDKTIVILLIGTTPAPFETGHGLAPEAHQMGVEVFRASIRMQFFHSEGQPLQDAAEASLHGLLPFFQHGHPFTPSNCHLPHVQAKSGDAVTAFPMVLQQIDFTMARLIGIPRNTLLWHRLTDLLRSRWPFLREALLATAILLHDPGHSRR